jgi:anti-sigma regulatory factor (Ser/Thr protein kinase)
MDEYMSRVRIWGFTCPGSPEEVGRVRRWTRDILRDSPCADDAALIVSELGANALLHTLSGDATGTFHVSLAQSDHIVSISVTDSGGTKTAPQVEHPNDDETHGRGLGMVNALAHRVEMSGDQHGHTVTAHLNHSKDLL